MLEGKYTRILSYRITDGMDNQYCYKRISYIQPSHFCKSLTSISTEHIVVVHLRFLAKTAASKAKTPRPIIPKV